MKYLLVEGITDVEFVKYICLQNGENLHKPQDSFMHKKENEFIDTNLWDLEKEEFQPIIKFILEIFKNN